MAFDYRKDYFRYKNYYIKAQQLYQKPVLKASFSLILSLIALSIFGLFAIKPTLETIAKLRKDLETQREVETKLEKKLSDLKKAQAAYVLIENDLRFLNLSLPRDPEFVRLVWEINYIGYLNNVHLIDGSFSSFPFIEESSAGDLNTQDIKIAIIGEYEDIVRFVQELETIDRIISVNSLAINSKTKVAREGIAAFVSASTYWHPKAK